MSYRTHIYQSPHTVLSFPFRAAHTPSPPSHKPHNLVAEHKRCSPTLNVDHDAPTQQLSFTQMDIDSDFHKMNIKPQEEGDTTIPMDSEGSSTVQVLILTMHQGFAFHALNMLNTKPKTEQFYFIFLLLGIELFS